jgi:hypothetical protein
MVQKRFGRPALSFLSRGGVEAKGMAIIMVWLRIDASKEPPALKVAFGEAGV